MCKRRNFYILSCNIFYILFLYFIFAVIPTASGSFTAALSCGGEEGAKALPGTCGQIFVDRRFVTIITKRISPKFFFLGCNICDRSARQQYRHFSIVLVYTM